VGLAERTRFYWRLRTPTTWTGTVTQNGFIRMRCPFYDEAGWAAYLKHHPLKSWGVDLIKMDVSWMMPGDFKDWANETQYMLSWKPYPTKWPNGMTFGKLAEEHQLLASLYLPNFCDGALSHRRRRPPERVGGSPRLRETKVRAEGPDPTSRFRIPLWIWQRTSHRRWTMRKAKSGSGFFPKHVSELSMA
jgi:hypothetical protein